jgi:hypothetical protein
VVIEKQDRGDLKQEVQKLLPQKILVQEKQIKEYNNEIEKVEKIEDSEDISF